MKKVLSVALMVVAVGGSWAADKAATASAKGGSQQSAAAKTAKVASPKAGASKVATGKKMSLAAARAQIGSCIAAPSKMRQIVRQLAPADQVAFVAEVNEAISKMPGSADAKVATFVNVNRAAVLGATPGNKLAVIAEVFATVPLVSLTAVNESFAKDLLNPKADPSRQFSNEQFQKAAETIVEKVAERCASTDNAAVRDGFAVLTMIRASNNAIEGLAESLVQKLPAEVQTTAKTEWLPAALGQNQTKTYEPMLGSADIEGSTEPEALKGDAAVTPPAATDKKTDEETDAESETVTDVMTEAEGGGEPVEETLQNDVIIRLPGPQLLESMLGDVVEQTPLINNSNDDEIYREGVREQDTTSAPATPVEFEEPIGYQGQTL